MNLRTLPLALVFSGALAFSAWAAAPTPDYRDYILYAPPPEYPQLARETHLEGEGIFEAKINPESGAIAKVVILQSTGYKILDAASIGAIRETSQR